MKNNLSNVLLPLATLSLASCAGQQKEEPKRPNIIFMMTDDHTTQAMSCYGGNLLQTPNMDRIANEGIRMDNCYAVNALSGPSRACVLTGKFSHENGFTDNASTFNGDQQTFPKLLQQAGYQTAMIGKWHLISEPQGFDHWSILRPARTGRLLRPRFLGRRQTYRRERLCHGHHHRQGHQIPRKQGQEQTVLHDVSSESASPQLDAGSAPLGHL